MKKLIYIVNQRIPTEKAYGLQIAKMGEAFADHGVELNLVAPTRKNQIKHDFFDFYSVKRNFRIKKLLSPDFYFPGELDRVAVAVKSFISALVISAYSIFRKADFFYSRDELPLYFLSFFKKNLVFEVHRFSGKRVWFYERFKKKSLKLVAISQNLKNELVKFGFAPDNILAAHDGVDLKEFDLDIAKEEARDRFGLPKGKVLLGYVGQLRTMGLEKGIELAFEALRDLPEDMALVLVGGEGRDLDFYKSLSKDKGLEDRVIFVGPVRHRLVPAYLKSFDLLLMPFPRTKHYAFYMSPLKLFEYMASRRPIVASDLPTVREVLNEENSVLVRPDDPGAFAKGIKKVLEDRHLADKISRKAFEDVKNRTWTKRAAKILSFING